MIYMLDTNICIYLIKNQPKSVAKKFASCNIGDVVISSITEAELWHGVMRNPETYDQNKQSLTSLFKDIPTLPFSCKESKIYGELRAQSKKKKASLDHLIAAHAISESCILVTNNEKDFQYFNNLNIENWI